MPRSQGSRSFAMRELLRIAAKKERPTSPPPSPSLRRAGRPSPPLRGGEGEDDAVVPGCLEVRESLAAKEVNLVTSISTGWRRASNGEIFRRLTKGRRVKRTEIRTPMPRAMAMADHEMSAGACKGRKSARM